MCLYSLLFDYTCVVGGGPVITGGPIIRFNQVTLFVPARNQDQDYHCIGHFYVQ
jgi:hypothetical protein